MPRPTRPENSTICKPETEFSSPPLGRLHQYWLSKHRNGRLPGRADIDPLDIPDILHLLTLLDVVRRDSTLRFRFRLYGTEVAERTSQELTGRWVDQCFDPVAAQDILVAYTDVAETMAPHYWRSDVPLAGREHVSYERLMCPLSTDGETVDMLIGVFDFAEKD